ncbi:MAG: ribonuclease P protein component [Myxococcota bacterium]|nr:ribonuclease P protein component [Myxococcota bacterium]
MIPLELGFGRHLRLRKRRHFLRTQRRGQRINAGRVFLFMADHRGPNRRFGFTVSKKVGCAVVRNRVRRKLKEIVRLNRQAFPEKRCYVIIAHPDAADADYQTLYQDMMLAAEQAKRLMANKRMK